MVDIPSPERTGHPVERTIMSDSAKSIEEALGLIDILVSQWAGRQPELKPTFAKLRRILESLVDEGRGKQWIDLSSDDLSTTHFLARVERGTVVFTLLDKDIISDLPVQRVRETMKALSEADGPKNCIIDLSKVRFISSVPLGGIITLNREALGRGGKLIMCLAQPVIRDFFRVTMLDTIIPMVDRFDDAVKCTED